MISIQIIPKIHINREYLSDKRKPSSNWSLIKDARVLRRVNERSPDLLQVSADGDGEEKASHLH